MRRVRLPLSRRGFIGAVALVAAAPARAASPIRLAAQKTGTFAWELDVIANRGLAKSADIALETTEFASPQAAELALLAGEVDIIISDWLYVSRARSLGEHLTFFPYSSAIGAVMTPPSSSIASLHDLKGKTLAVAGGALDKSWLIVQGAALREGLDLKTEASIVYGAPSLLAAKARQGEFAANLNFWNFCAELEAEGFHRLAGVEQLAMRLGATGPLTNLGYVFSEDWARRNEAALGRFLEVTRQAKDVLAETPAEWERLKPRLNLRDANSLTVLRQRYGQGIPRRSVEAEEADARTLYALLARLGGVELVGKAGELDPGTFYKISSGG
ncbi:MAG: ABC transporter substrate-binding protein [Hyphomicrobiales bacterium]|nr:ABC transporter substrate-binding protein [Hyphomicrobiales bacterium]